MAKDGFTEEQHREFGAQLKRMHSELTTLQTAISKAYGSTSGNVDRVRTLVTKVGQVRSVLEEHFIQEHDLNKTHPDWHQIYYGSADTSK